MSSVTQSLDSLLAGMHSSYSVTQSFGRDDNGNIALDKYGNVAFNGDAITYNGVNFNDAIWKESNQLGKDHFLKLLMVQMQYQDPLSPMENTEFISQMAQFSSLEIGQNTATAIENLNIAFQENLAAQLFASTSISNSSAMSLIGREVRMRQVVTSFDGTDDAQIPIQVHLGNHESAVVKITDAEGNVIRRINVSGQDKDAENSVTVYWDGLDDKGKKVEKGNYLVGAQGVRDGDELVNDSSVYTFVQAVVEGVRFTADGVLVKIDGREISLVEVLDVSMGEGSVMSQPNALSLLGKQVRARQTTVNFSGAANEERSILINATPNQKMTVEIKEQSGNRTIATLTGTADDKGYLQLFWDGTMSSGDKAPAGQYNVHVVGSDKNTGLYAYTEGIVDGLTSLTGDYKVKVNGLEISLNDILAITTPRG